jgi:hypothetical protein
VVYRDVTRQAKGLYRLKHVGALKNGLAYLSRYNSGWFCHTCCDTIKARLPPPPVLRCASNPRRIASALTSAWMKGARRVWQHRGSPELVAPGRRLRFTAFTSPPPHPARRTITAPPPPRGPKPARTLTSSRNPLLPCGSARSRHRPTRGARTSLCRSPPPPRPVPPAPQLLTHVRSRASPAPAPAPRRRSQAPARRPPASALAPAPCCFTRASAARALRLVPPASFRSAHAPANPRTAARARRRLRRARVHTGPSCAPPLARGRSLPRLPRARAAAAHPSSAPPEPHAPAPAWSRAAQRLL